MNGFKRKSIYRWEKKAARWAKGHLVLTVLLLFFGVLMLKGVVGAMKVGKPFSVTQIVTHAISNGISVDTYGHTNILLLGIGGEGHEGGTLTDTMIVASIDHRDNLVSMLSIPRDLFVRNEVVGWGTRINGVYEYAYENLGDEEEALDTLRKQIEEIVGVNIHYHAMIDFSGFEDIVDAVGGVEITLDGNFYDPYYPGLDPDAEDPYAPFFLAAGTQTIDGETALKYVRSRKTSSDFDRSARQQEVISAIKDKATRLGFLLNPNKIKNTYSAVRNNFTTNMSTTEMISLAQFAQNIETEDIISHVITDEAYLPGGFLYTPEREYYEGAFVLIPFAGEEDFSEIQTFAQLIFYHAELFTHPVSLQVLNSTKTEGLAGLTKMYLTRYGFNVEAYGNAATIDATETSIFSSDSTQELSKDAEETMTLLNILIPKLREVDETPEDYQASNWEQRAELIIELGSDFAEYYKENQEQFYVGFY